MCQATIYLVRSDQQEEVMRNTTRLTVLDDGVRLETFFEEPRVVHGTIAHIDFLRHTVTLVSPEDEVGRES
jgi:predicted RNA-binding protein